MAGLRILALSQSTPVAPAGIWLEAAGITGFAASETPAALKDYDPSFHNITYRWSVIGQPLPAFTAPQNMIPEWNDPNRAYGKRVSFFFPDPGTYQVEVVAEDADGTTARAEISLTVADPDTLYQGARTICVSFDPGETWQDTPEGARRAATPTDVKNALRVSKEPARLRFKRGQSYEGLDLRIEKTQLGQIDAWGNGPAPVLKGVHGPLFQIHKRSKLTGLTIADLAFEGAWDSITERGYSTTSPLLWINSPTPALYAIWNCHFSGFDHLDFETGDLPSIILVGNSTITNWRNFGFLLRSANARFALVGTSVAQSVDALHGGPKSGALSNNHGPVRVTDCAHVYIGASDFFSRTGWSGLADELADQPCLRLNTSGTRGSAFNLDRIVCEGGYHLINLRGSNPRVEENPGNYLIDKALLIGTAKTIGPFIAVDFGGLTVRNTLGILPDTPRKHPNRWLGALRSKADNPGRDNATTPMQVYSSSFLNLATGGNDTGTDWMLHDDGDAFLNTSFENNLLYDPLRRPAGLTPRGALAGITPRFSGVRYNFRNPRGNLARNIPPGDGFLIPYDEITEDAWDSKSGAPTSEGFWAKIAETNPWHMLWIRGVRQTLYAHEGDFELYFGEEGAFVVNSGRETWPGEARFEVRFDRAALVPAPDATYASPETLPIPIPVPGDRAYQSATAGLVARDDFFGRPRGASPSQGAFEPE